MKIQAETHKHAPYFWVISHTRTVAVWRDPLEKIGPATINHLMLCSTLQFHRKLIIIHGDFPGNRNFQRRKISENSPKDTHMIHVFPRFVPHHQLNHHVYPFFTGKSPPFPGLSNFFGEENSAQDIRLPDGTNLLQLLQVLLHHGHGTHIFRRIPANRTEISGFLYIMGWDLKHV